MKGDDRQPPPNGQYLHRLGQSVFQRGQFIIHSDAQSQKGLGSGVESAASPHHLGHYASQFSRAFDGPMERYGSGDRFRFLLLAIPLKETSQLLLGEPVHQICRRQLLPGGEAHIQRAVPEEREPPLWSTQL
jgi:hypothetical protein